MDINLFMGVCIFLSLCFISCKDRNDERTHPLFQKAKRLKNKGDYKESAAAFEEYLKINPESDRSKIELATLYDDFLEENFMSAYYYRQYLKTGLNEQDAENVQKWINACEKDYLKTLIAKYGIPENYSSGKNSADSAAGQEKTEKLTIQIEELQNKNRKYKKVIQKMYPLYKKNLKDKKTSGEKLIVEEKNSENELRKKRFNLYKVKPGDSLYKISRSVFGTGKYYNKIFEANKDSMDSPNDLKIGQELVIPEINE